MTYTKLAPFLIESQAPCMFPTTYLVGLSRVWGCTLFFSFFFPFYLSFERVTQLDSSFVIHRVGRPFSGVEGPLFFFPPRGLVLRLPSLRVEVGFFNISFCRTSPLSPSARFLFLGFFRTSSRAAVFLRSCFLVGWHVCPPMSFFYTFAAFCPPHHVWTVSCQFFNFPLFLFRFVQMRTEARPT